MSDIQKLRKIFEDFLEHTCLPSTLIDFDTKLDSIKDIVFVKYIFYTTNHKYILTLLYYNGVPYFYLSMQPRLPATGSKSLPVFDLYEAVLCEKNLFKAFMNILSCETLPISERIHEAKLQFEDNKLVWKK